MRRERELHFEEYEKINNATVINMDSNLLPSVNVRLLGTSNTPIKRGHEFKKSMKKKKSKENTPSSSPMNQTS